MRARVDIRRPDRLASLAEHVDGHDVGIGQRPHAHPLGERVRIHLDGGELRREPARALERVLDDALVALTPVQTLDQSDSTNEP